MTTERFGITQDFAAGSVFGISGDRVGWIRIGGTVTCTTLAHEDPRRLVLARAQAVADRHGTPVRLVVDDGRYRVLLDPAQPWPEGAVLQTLIPQGAST